MQTKLCINMSLPCTLCANYSEKSQVMLTNVVIQFCSKHDNQLFYTSKSLYITAKLDSHGSNAMFILMVEGGDFSVNTEEVLCNWCY